MRTMSERPQATDQAATLRAWSHRTAAQLRRPVEAHRPLQVIAIGSGKGGVGKTSLAANVAAKFAQDGARVLALDGDLGLANLDIALGVRPSSSLFDVLHDGADIERIVMPTPSGVNLLPGCSGRFELANLSEREQQRLFTCIDTLENAYDVLIVDTAAGIGANALAMAAAAQQVAVVITPDPSSMADAYAFIKVLSCRFGVQHFQILANLTRSEREGEDLYARLSAVLDRFLTVRVDFLGSIPHDRVVAQGMRMGIPCVLQHPYAPASTSITAVCKKLVLCNEATNLGGLHLFWRRLLTERGSL